MSMCEYQTVALEAESDEDWEKLGKLIDFLEALTDIEVSWRKAGRGVTSKPAAKLN